MPVLPGQLFQQFSQGSHVLLRPQQGQTDEIGPRRVAGFAGIGRQVQIQALLFGEALQGLFDQDMGVVGLVAGPMLRPLSVGGGAKIEVRRRRRGEHSVGPRMKKRLSVVLLQPLGSQLLPALGLPPGSEVPVGGVQVDGPADGEEDRQNHGAEDDDGFSPGGIAPPGGSPGAFGPGRLPLVLPRYAQEAVEGLIGRVLGGVLCLVGGENPPANFRGQVRMPAQEILQQEDEVHVGPDA